MAAASSPSTTRLESNRSAARDVPTRRARAQATPSATGARDDHGPDIRVGLSPVEDPAVLGLHAGGPRVQPVGPVERDQGDAVIGLAADRLQVHSRGLAGCAPW